MSLRRPTDSEPQHGFEWTTADGPSSAVVQAVSTVADEDPLDIEPLYDVVDPDALDTLFTQSQYYHGPPNGSIQFEYHSYTVVIKANGRGYICD